MSQNLYTSRHTFIEPPEGQSGCAFLQDGRRCRKVKHTDVHSLAKPVSHAYVGDSQSGTEGCGHLQEGVRCRLNPTAVVHLGRMPQEQGPGAEPLFNRQHTYLPGPGQRGPCTLVLADGSPCGMARLAGSHVSPLGFPTRARPDHLMAKHTVEHRHPGFDLPLGVLIDVVEAAIEQGAPPTTAVEWQRGGGGQRDDEPAYSIIRLTWEA